jgi:hypothetical protein
MLANITNSHGINTMIYVAKSAYFSKIMMNILPRNPADREAKSPCDKYIRYPVCVPMIHRMGLLTTVVYDKQKTVLVDDPVHLINTRRLYPGRKPLDLGTGYSSATEPANTIVLAQPIHLIHEFRIWCYIFMF